MRDNLWDDPRIAKVIDMTDSSEAAVIGSLYWLWSTADQHTEDGLMPGLTLRSINRKTGVQGFAEALCAINWLEDRQDGVFIVDFEKHNGASAKKRCQTAKRVANFEATNGKGTKEQTSANADSVSSALATNADSVSSALAREREEKNTNTPLTPVGGICVKADSKTAKPELTPGFANFWQTWPNTDRKQARGKCFEIWKKARLEADAAVICGHVSRLKNCESWTKQGGQFIPSPVPYLTQRRWEGADESSLPSNDLGVFL